MTAAEADEAIAMAPGMLLARAATSPPASRRADGGGSGIGGGGPRVRLVLPDGGGDAPDRPGE